MILVVEDDRAVSQMIGFLLTQAKFAHKTARNAAEARELLASKKIALILMDWMLPGDCSGIDLTRELKKSSVTRHIPVIMLTARDEENDKIKGFNSGAEDFVTKPFSAKELIARIHALLKRVALHESEEFVSAGPILLNPIEHLVAVDGESVILSPTEFRLLHFFMTHPKKVFSREQLLDRVWGINAYREERTVDVHIKRLRSALKPHNVAYFIQTVRGSGYRFRPLRDT